MVVPSHLQSDGGAIPKIIMKNTGRWLVVIIVVALGGGMVWQWRALRMAQADASKLKEGQQTLSELLRSRAEKSYRWKLLNKMRKERLAADRKAAAIAAGEEEQEPSVTLVEDFTATLTTELAPRQTLVTGGWKLPNGNRAIVMIQPTLINHRGEPPQRGEAALVQVEAMFAEMPEEVLDKVGLQMMRTTGEESEAQEILEPAAQQRLKEQLGSTSNVNVLSGPQMTTISGRQAQVQMLNTVMIDGVQRQVGPSLRVYPIVYPDGNTLEMTVDAQLRKPNHPQK